MNKHIKDSLILLVITFACNWLLYIPYRIYCFFDAPGIPYYVDEEILIDAFCIAAELIMFSIIGSFMRCNYKSLILYFALSIPFCFISTALRGYGTYEMMMLNMVVPSYPSFAKSLIGPLFETTFKAIVLLISSRIANKRIKGSMSSNIKN